MASIRNLMKRNPGMTAAGIIFLIALIVVIIWLVTGGQEKKGQAGPGDAAAAAVGVVPELTVSGMKTVKSVNTSEYTPMRYEFLGKLRGDNIDYEIIINTKGGFEENSISKLMINRKTATRDTNGNINPGTTLLTTKNKTPILNYKTYRVKFSGSELMDDAVSDSGGYNYFEVVGYVIDDSGAESKYITNPSGDATPLASTTIEILEADLNYTLPENTSTTFDWTITSGGTVFNVNKGDHIRTQYIIAFTTKPVSLIPIPTVTSGGVTTGGGYKFKTGDNTFLTVDNETDFKLDKFGDKYRLYNDKKIVTKEGGTGGNVLKEPSNMTAAEAEAAMTDITLVIPGQGDYIESKNKYVGAGGAVPSSWGWSAGAVGDGGDISTCVNQCNGSPSCVGFDIIDDICYFKINDSNKNTGPYTDDQGNKYPANYYGKPK